MSQILKVIPRDVHAVIDLSLSEVEKLLDFLNVCVCNFADEDEKMIKAFEYVDGQFTENLKEIKKFADEAIEQVGEE